VNRTLFAVGLIALSLLANPLWGVQEPKPEVRSNPNRPASAELLPEGTVVYLQIHNVREFVARMNESAVAKAMANEKLAVLVDKLWGEVKNQYEKVRDDVGVSLDELTQLLTGELCFAVVSFKDRMPGVVLMFDYDPESETLSKLLATGRRLAENDGATFETTPEGDVEIETVHGDGQDIFFFDSSGTFVASSDLELTKEMLARWRGEDVDKVRPLSQNRKFITIMNRCRGTKDAPPELRGYVDPIDLAKALTRGNFGARVVINSLQLVGLDGFLAAGGSVIYGEDGYESITHGHVLMANPRTGVLAMTALAPGDLTPEPWVSDETISYVSWNWDVERMYTELGKIIDAFQGEGAFAKLVEENVNTEIGLNLHDDILATLGGRISYVTWYEKPVKFNSQTNAIAFEIKDHERFSQSLETLMDRALEEINEGRDEPIEPRDDYRGVPCWKFDELVRGNRRPEEVDPEDEEDQLRRASVRQAFPNVALTDEYLIVSDSRAFIEKAIDTMKEDAAKLRDDEAFARVSRHMQRLLGTSVPGAIVYSRPERSLEMVFDMAKSEATGQFLARGAEENEIVAAFKRILDENPLPEFDELRPFFAPTGMYVTSDETGVHMLGFQLRPEDDR
jgi:hypothetical protein